MLNKNGLAIIFTLTACFSATTVASDRFIVFGGLSNNNIDVQGYTENFIGYDGGFTYQNASGFGLDIKGTVGSKTISGIDFTVTQLEFTPRYSFSINKSVNVFFRAGLAHGILEADYNGYHAEETDNGFVVGSGFEFFPHDRIMIRPNLSYANYGDVKNTNLGVDVGYRF